MSVQKFMLQVVDCAKIRCIKRVRVKDPRASEFCVDGFWQIFWRAFLNGSVQALLSLHRRRNRKSPRAKSATDRELLSRTPNVASLVFRFASTASYHHHHHCPSFQFISRVRIEQERRSVWLQKFLLDANFGLGPSLRIRVEVGPASKSNVNRRPR